MSVSLDDRASRVRALVLDIDGVMTDGKLHIDGNGNVSKRFGIRDGHALYLMRKHFDFPIAWVTGREDAVNLVRADDLHIARVIQGVRKKLPRVEEFAREAGCTLDEVAYMGDDVNDLPVLRAVGLSAAPANACAEVLETAAFVSRFDGGAGAVRELAELVLKAQDRWSAILGAFE